MQVTLQYAEDHFADIVSAVNRGEEVEIAQPDKPALKLAVIERKTEPGGKGSAHPMGIEPYPGPQVPPLIRDGRRVLGAGRGEMRVPSWEEWKAMDSQIAAEMTEIFPARRMERKHLFGAGEHLPGRLPTDEEWDAMDKEIADEMLNGPIFPPED